MSQRHREPLAVVQELGELPTSLPSALGATLAVPIPLQTPIPGPKSILSISVSGSAGQPQLQSFVPCHPLQHPSIPALGARCQVVGRLGCRFGVWNRAGPQTPCRFL